MCYQVEWLHPRSPAGFVQSMEVEESLCFQPLHDHWLHCNTLHGRQTHKVWGMTHKISIQRKLFWLSFWPWTTGKDRDCRRMVNGFHLFRAFQVAATNKHLPFLTHTHTPVAEATMRGVACSPKDTRTRMEQPSGANWGLVSRTRTLWHADCKSPPRPTYILLPPESQLPK